MTVVLAVAAVWVAVSIPCAVALGRCLRRLDGDQPPARHLQLVRP